MSDYVARRKAELAASGPRKRGQRIAVGPVEKPPAELSALTPEETAKLLEIKTAEELERLAKARARDAAIYLAKSPEERERDRQRHAAENRRSMERVKAQDAEMARRTLVKRRLIEFVRRFHAGYDAGWVHRDVCRRLERFLKAVVDKKAPRLMLFLPPRQGKSQLASISFPAWALGQYPWLEIISSSYAVSLPIGFSRKVRELLQDPAYKAVFPEASLDKTVAAAETWATTQGGGYIASGVGTGITGKGYHIGIIDDPIKDDEEASSETIREKVWDWYSSTFYTRAAPGAGILVILCMTGDTPVLMADGTEKRLDAVRVGDRVATFENGRLTTSVVRNWTPNGRDSVYKITTRSGRIVRANERHPFLVETERGLQWIRLKNLKSGQRIVRLKDGGGSGRARPAKLRGATNPFPAGVDVFHTTENGSGPSGTVRPLRTKIRGLVSTLSSGIATALGFLSMSTCSLSKTVCARFAKGPRNRPEIPRTGQRSCVSTTTTTPGVSAACSATTATSYSNATPDSTYLSLLSATSDFTAEEIISVEPDGIEEVFDVQIERTENFIANGLVSHNTRWHLDDLAGRLLAQRKRDLEEGASPADIDDWEVVSYPAIAVEDEYVNTDGTISDAPKNKRAMLVRRKGEALHPERFPLERLQRIKRTLQPRHWSALYQQNPVPDEGSYFTKSMIRYNANPPPTSTLRMFAAWDLAIGERQTNDWTVGVVGGLDYQDQLFVVDVLRFRGDSYRIAEAIVSSAARWGVELVGIERGQLEQAIKPTLLKLMREKRAKFTLAEGDKALTPISDKLSRARPLQGRMQQGMVFFDSSQPWCEGLVYELTAFPAAPHDDQVDALAWLMRMAMREDPPKPPRRKRHRTLESRLAQLLGDTERSAMSA